MRDPPKKVLLSYSIFDSKLGLIEKSHLKRIGEQAAAISSLQIENENLKEENEQLRLVLENYMKNFDCFMKDLNRTSALEEENLVLKQKLDQNLNVT